MAAGSKSEATSTGRQNAHAHARIILYNVRKAGGEPVLRKKRGEATMMCVVWSLWVREGTD